MDPNNHYQPMADFCPNEDYQFAEFLGKPFHPFIRTEKISRCCDFSKQTQVSKDAVISIHIFRKMISKQQAKKHLKSQIQKKQLSSPLQVHQSCPTNLTSKLAEKTNYHKLQNAQSTTKNADSRIPSTFSQIG